jgi:hypothetical protein
MMNFSKLTQDCRMKLGGQSETKQLDCGLRAQNYF